MKNIAGLVGGDQKVREKSLLLVPSPFNTWEAGDVFSALVDLGGFARIRRQRGEKSPLFAAFEPTDLIAGYAIIMDWPNSLEKLVASITAGRDARQRELLGPLGKIFDGDAALTPLRKLIREAVPEILRKGDVALKSYRGVRSSWLSQGDLITGMDAARLLTFDRSIIRRLSKDGDCLVSKFSRSRWCTLYNFTQLKRSIGVLKSAIRANECARILGVPAYCVDAFAEEGLLSRIADRDAVLMAGEPLFERQSFDEMVERLRQMPTKTPPANAISVLEALRGTLHPGSWAAVFQAIATRQISVSGHRRGVRSLADRLLVERTAVSAFIGQLELPALTPGIYASCLGAERATGIRNMLLGGAVQAGLLKGRKTSKGIMVSIQNLQSFNLRYVFGGSAAKQVGLSRLKFTARARSAGVRPVARIENTLLWKRKEIVREFRELRVPPD